MTEEKDAYELLDEEVTGEYNPLFTVDKTDYKRECGDCTMCCQGWLSGQVYEYTMSKNNPCHFLDQCGDRCTIYKDRPEMCQNYKCEWLQQPVCFPLWMRPDKVNVIITWREGEYQGQKIGYWSARECGKTMEAHVLNWIIQTARQHNVNVCYEINDVRYMFGDPVFEEYMKNEL